ncbi:PEP-CTERM sorting domain-containing protein [Phenylobacterium parvum]|uniref:PEP-CTERM sorting domain-containing protein n=1 Tax=Phenylobacterium parvum TaxID=2201350 RepID=A0A2Z3HPH0_9CAUL|nr:PEP-CTERM sorting domain-containing protein [Phenylobacterium parvum]AWM76645.1 PEP-CTERM sorting domain-containing protein [Phenylobacterium parvum]
MRAVRPVLAALALSLAATAAWAESILFVGNSFTFGATSPVLRYRPEQVTDLNREGIGGVPAIFKVLTTQARLDYKVSLETSPGKNFDWHLANRMPLIDRPWDVVILQGQSTLDLERPGDPTRLIESGRQLSDILAQKNPSARIYYQATWSRADLTYLKPSPWKGKPIAAMARDVRAGYDRARAASKSVRGVLPVGEAWNRAMETGVADPNPYDGVAFGKVDLWGWDQYHASAAGYYLSALVIFGAVTGMDPRTFGEREVAAYELGLSPTQARGLQKAAYDQLKSEGLMPEAPTP